MQQRIELCCRGELQAGGNNFDGIDFLVDEVGAQAEYAFFLIAAYAYLVSTRCQFCLISYLPQTYLQFGLDA